MTKLRTRWPKFNKWIKAENWQKAASESHRKKPVPAQRNQYVKSLLEQAAKNMPLKNNP